MVTTYRSPRVHPRHEIMHPPPQIKYLPWRIWFLGPNKIHSPLPKGNITDLDGGVTKTIALRNGSVFGGSVFGAALIGLWGPRGRTRK